MNRTARLLFPAALGLSAAAHLLVLFLLPYSPAQPARRQAEPIPVRLLEAPRPAPQPLAASRRQAARAKPEPLPAQPPEPARPPQPQPVPQTAPQPAVPEEPLELAPPEPSSGGAQKEAAGSEPAATGSPSGTGTDTTATLAAEIAATQAVLSSLRARIVEKIRYPALARANGWKGTVLLELLLDERGLLQGLAVRRSSGYAVLDRAAAALMRSVTPVDNPLGRPLRIEVPIAYELKE